MHVLGENTGFPNTCAIFAGKKNLRERQPARARFWANSCQHPKVSESGPPPGLKITFFAKSGLIWSQIRANLAFSPNLCTKFRSESNGNTPRYHIISFYNDYGVGWGGVGNYIKKLPINRPSGQYVIQPVLLVPVRKAESIKKHEFFGNPTWVACSGT